ncbi:MAG: hypothetical protein HOP12_00710 [Candidatus Eisenbacteria bacterium]|uniref:Zinc-finger domain-containing protein n=1 Tax=Eiseniibacteriota bacterium TaxID=2212470 RepID=A0A849SBD2_UNCEI|nr:hypothetical protein [Candidatus Eisenbacteria bacterium]
MHLDEEQIQRLRHGELAASEELAALEHLAACIECRSTVDEAEREERNVDALLESVDRAAPRVDAETIVVRSAARARTRPAELARQAAGFALVVVLAGAAYAAPGSPLPAWVAAVAGWVGERTEAPAQVEPTRSHEEFQAGGITVPIERELVIEFSSIQSAGEARVTLTDGAEVSVHAPIGAANFTSGVRQLVVDNRGSSASFEVEIPRHAPWVEIRVAGRQLFLKDGPRITTAASADSSPPYRLRLTTF